MGQFLVNVSVLDVLIFVAVALVCYLIYIKFLRNNNNSYVVPANNVEKPSMLNENAVNTLLNSADTNVSSNNARATANSLADPKEKLRASTNVKNYHLLDQSDVVNKENYICNKECPCDERTIGESLEDIRKQFMNPTESFYGNVAKSKGIALDEGFKLNNGQEHTCQPKAMDQPTLNYMLGCKGQEFAKTNQNNLQTGNTAGNTEKNNGVNNTEVVANA
jgi:hypothetical protein